MMNRLSQARGLIAVGIVLLLTGGACNKDRGASSDSESQRRALGLLLPKRITVQPFTRITLEAGEGTPGELVVYLRAEDQFGDPVKAAGMFNFELYEYQQASLERKGSRIELWQTSVLDDKDQLRYWDRTSQMYEFRLLIKHLAEERGTANIDSGKAVIHVTYNTPWGEHLADEYILSARDTAELTQGD